MHHPVPRALERATTVAIVVNFGVAAWGFVDEPHAATAEMAENVILGFFAVEMAVRLKMQGLPFFRNGWNCFDALVVAVSLLPMVGDGLVALRILRLARLARMVHTMRHVAHLRVMYRVWQLRRRVAEPVV